MKRLLLLLPLLLCLWGCGPLDADPPRTEPPVSPPVIEMPSPELPQTLPVPGAPEESETPSPSLTEPESSPSGQETVPPPELPEQPARLAGDTTPSWNPARAEAFPADAACDPALLLEKWLAVEGLTAADLEARDCGQLILTAAQAPEGVETVTVCYERDESGAFVPAEGLSRLAGYVGRNGIKHDRKRDSFTSPAGLWALGYAFGNEAPPEGLKLPWRQVTPNSDWVCDSDSVYFNTWQERDDPALTESWSDDVEHLENYPTQYAWACVIEFNLPPEAVPERGCAIFLHCSEGGTAGCVGLRRADMYAVLQWLDPEKQPYILITGTERDA